VEREQPIGVIVQLGGQTPLKLTHGLEAAGVRILGTSPDAIDAAEDRRRFDEIARRLGIRQPDNGTATSVAEAQTIAARIGYPVLVRPSYVLGGRAMEIVYDDAQLTEYFGRAVRVSEERPVLIDSFLEDAFEADVDAIADGQRVVIAGIMQHIEDAGIHSGDSACVLPPYLITERNVQAMREHTVALAEALGVRGLINVQYAIKDDILYVLEANPRASRTVPFVSKATAVQLAKAAARIAVGETIAGLRAAGVLPATGDGADLPADMPIAVKEAVLPFHRFRTAEGQHVDTLLGPEMKSTGEVMGLDARFGTAFAKSQAAAYGSLPLSGTVFVSVANRDKRSAIFPVKRLADLGFTVLATAGTAQVLHRNGVPCQVVGKYSEGPGNVVERILAGDVDMVVNTPFGSPGNSGPRMDGYEIRTAAVAAGIPCITTVQGMAAAVQGIEGLRTGGIGVQSLQELHATLTGTPR
jgi:carbamoyl-phosphate synthase large subunit